MMQAIIKGDIEVKTTNKSSGRVSVRADLPSSEMLELGEREKLLTIRTDTVQYGVKVDRVFKVSEALEHPRFLDYVEKAIEESAKAWLLYNVNDEQTEIDMSIAAVIDYATNSGSFLRAAVEKSERARFAKKIENYPVGNKWIKLETEKFERELVETLVRIRD